MRWKCGLVWFANKDQFFGWKKENLAIWWNTINKLQRKTNENRIVFLSFRCIVEKRCNRFKFQAKPLGSQENDIIEIRTVKFNLTADAALADASICPNNRDICCPGRFVEPSKPVEPIKAIETGISYW